MILDFASIQLELEKCIVYINVIRGEYLEQNVLPICIWLQFSVDVSV